MRKGLVFLTFVFVQLINAQQIDPLLAKDGEAQKIWVDSIMKSMSVDEKIGQLFMVQAYSNKDKKHEKFITNMIQKYHVGNLILCRERQKNK